MFGKARMTAGLFTIGLMGAVAGWAAPAAAQQQKCYVPNMPAFAKSVNDHKASRPTSSQNPWNQDAMHATANCQGAPASAKVDRKSAQMAAIKAQQAAIDAQRQAAIKRFLGNRQAAKMPQIYVPNANPQGPHNNAPMLLQKRTYQNHSSMSANGQAPQKVPSHFKNKYK